MRFTCLLILLFFLPALIQADTVSNKRVALVLSGGSERGFAHIGALKALEKAGIKPSFIAGTSMGAVIGGLYAAGFSADSIQKMAISADWNGLFTDNPRRRDVFYTRKEDDATAIAEFRLDHGKPSIPNALVNGHSIINYLIGLTLPAIGQAKFNFDSLPIPFRASATNLYTGERVVIDRGGLAEAMRASLAVPFLFTPFSHDMGMLVDGGFTNVLPIDVALKSNPDLVVAIHVPSPLYNEEKLKNPLRFIDQVVSFCLLNQSHRTERDSAIIIIPEFDSLITEGNNDLILRIAAGEKAVDNQIGSILTILNQQENHTLHDQIHDEQISINKIVVKGGSVFAQAKIISMAGLMDSMKMKPDSLKNRLKSIRGYYLEKGYSLATVSYSVDTTGILTINIDEGKVFDLLIRGNNRTDESIILREMTTVKKSLFNQTRMERDIRNILATGLFEQAYFSFSLDSAGNFILNVVVKEKLPDIFSLGVRYDNVRLLEGFLGFRNDNLGGRAVTFEGLAQYGLRREKYMLSLKTDRFWISYLAADAKAYFYRDRKYIQDPSDSSRYIYNSLRKLGITASIAHQIFRIGKLSYVILFEQYRSSEDKASALGNIFKYSPLRIASLRAEIDSYDDKYFPVSGAKVYTSADMGLNFLGASSGFFNLTVTASSANSIN
ncbi:MAG: patatin-like phospholipase family protein, partial [Fibrobacteres bacterium]|nr:patatin-like phospholipase family protein [Fibrobacterota bacterium]